MSNQNELKSKVKKIISWIQNWRADAEKDCRKWNDTLVTYGDTKRSASDVNFGREEAFEEVLSELEKLV